MPFHEGERAVQAHLGEADAAARVARVIAHALEPAMARFVAEQSFVVAGSIGADGARWASLVPGEPGFAHADGAHTIELDLGRAHPADPVLAAGDRVGLLFLDPVNQRRLRVNGRATRRDSVLRVTVAEVYPNCSRHVRRRRVRPAPAASGDEPQRGTALGDAELALVRQSDTCFVASAHPTGHADVSHRGGPPGFVRVIDARTLEIPDYAGNHMYNTLGNLLVDPRAGLAFVDFATGRALLTTGRADVPWVASGTATWTSGPDVTGSALAPDARVRPTRGPLPEAERAWRLTIDRWLSFELAIRAE